MPDNVSGSSLSVNLSTGTRPAPRHRLYRRRREIDSPASPAPKSSRSEGGGSGTRQKLVSVARERRERARTGTVIAGGGPSHPLEAGTRPSGREGNEKRFADGSNVCYTGRVTSNTLTIRLRRPKAEIAAAAKPNVNAWINKLIDRALASPSVEWPEHFERKSRSRCFRYGSDEVRARQRR